MSFPGNMYAPPGVYTRTNYDNPTIGLLQGLKIPVFLAPGSESLSQADLEMVRGSSATVDQQVVGEDMDGRSVVSISDAGAYTLGAFDGVLTKLQVRNYPIVKGDGTGSTSTSSSSVSVSINDDPVVVLAIDGANGVLTLATAPELGDTVRITYFYNRTDTSFTNDLSDQVTVEAATLYGAVGQSYIITEDESDELLLTVDGTSLILLLTKSSSGWTAAQVVSQINSQVGSTSLVASTYVDNHGATAIKLVADKDIVVGSGSANSVLGFTAASTTARNKTFYVFHQPIVDGSNGGITTTDTADVTVKVDGVQVIPSSVDGANGKIVLSQAPKSGATVSVTYHHNTYQDTFDYLAHNNVTDITRCGYAPGRSDFTDETDFVLGTSNGNSIIMWGTSVTTTAGVHTTGAEYFDETQITPTLVDARAYLAPCTAVTDGSVSPPKTSQTVFTVPHVPTTGNGRNSPLGSSLFQTVSNSRIDLPTNRPDLVTAYWGYGVQDAIERGSVTVLSVDSTDSKITLASKVPVGASVYCTYYYNTLVDQEYTLTAATAEASGVGTYSISNEAGVSVLAPQFGSKSSGLSTVTLQFPSGSERKPDCRIESPLVTTAYVGPVEETVTVTIKNVDSTLGKWSAPNPGPYYFVTGASDKARVQVDGSDVAGSTGHDLSNHQSEAGLGFCASLLGDEITYDADVGSVTYDILATNNGLVVRVDGVEVTGTSELTATGTAANFVTALNRPTQGEDGTGQANVTATQIILASSASAIDDYYNGWEVVLTNNVPSGTLGLSGTITDYNGTTKVATVDVTFATVPTSTTTYRVYDPDVRPQYVGSTYFTSSVDIASSEYDQIQFRYVGNVDGATSITVSIGAGTYASATTLAAAVQAGLVTAGVGPTITSGETFQVACSANSNGQLVFKLTKSYTDQTGYIEFITGTAARDFCILAGIDTAASDGAQSKLIDGAIAKRFTIAGDNSSALKNDRIVLRNRIMPGAGTLSGHAEEAQCELNVSSGTANSLAGLVANEYGVAGVSAVIKPASLLGRIGLSDGQGSGFSDVRDGQPVTTFYAAGGTTAQNNVFKFTFDGTPVTVSFKDATGTAIASGSSADVPLGPAGTSNTIIDQINDAMAAAGITTPVTLGYLLQEGLGIRMVSALNTSASSIAIGTGSANTVLGFTDNDLAQRVLPSARLVASSLMGGINTSAAESIEDWDESTAISAEFAATGLAGIVKDASNAEYLFIQSRGASGLGTASSVAWAAAAADDVMSQGTQFGVEAGDGGAGEAGISGFYVTSSDTEDGSGTANDSVLNPSNDGLGSDGVVGQTYRDGVTGLTFTLLARSGSSNYPDGESFTFLVTSEITSDSNSPNNAIPGVELLVTNTLDVTSGDTSIVETYERGGSQPSIGDVYYTSYDYSKTDFQTRLFTKFASIEQSYGTLNPANPATLAAYLAMLNGAVLVGVKQVQKASGSTQASVSVYRDAVDELEGKLPGNIGVDLLVPMLSDSTLYAYMARHADIQSSIRYRAERTVIGGLSAGTQPKAARAVAEAVAATRVRLVYPDMATLTLTDAYNVDEEFLVDGTYLSAAMVGAVVSPRRDVATPWTGMKLVGFNGLARTLDAVEQNQTAQSGLTVLEDRPPILRVRHGLTTDMSNILTKTPTVVQIADEVQQQTRVTLERFIGIKFLPGVLSQIEGQMSNTLKLMVEAQIITAYTGVLANVSSDDPTVAEVEAAYQPVFPLLYIVVTFSLRSSL